MKNRERIYGNLRPNESHGPLYRIFLNVILKLFQNIYQNHYN